MKQPIARAALALDGTPALHYEGQPCDRVVAEMSHTVDRLVRLKSAGLSVQIACTLARTAMAGDAVYLQQSQPLTTEQTESLDRVVFDGMLKILGISRLEVEEDLHKQRWFLPWKEASFGLASASLSSKANFVSSWLGDVATVSSSMGLATLSAVLDYAQPFGHVLDPSHKPWQHKMSKSYPRAWKIQSSFFRVLQRQSVALKWSHSLHKKSAAVPLRSSSQRCSSLEEVDVAAGWQLQGAAQHCLTNQEFTTSVRVRMNLDVHRTPPDLTLTCAHKGGQRVGFRMCRQAADPKGLHPFP